MSSPPSPEVTPLGLRLLSRALFPAPRAPASPRDPGTPPFAAPEPVLAVRLSFSRGITCRYTARSHLVESLTISTWPYNPSFPQFWSRGFLTTIRTLEPPPRAPLSFNWDTLPFSLRFLLDRVPLFFSPMSRVGLHCFSYQSFFFQGSLSPERVRPAPALVFLPPFGSFLPFV